MKRLLTIYRQPGLDLSGTTLVRKAYRAIIARGDRYLLVQSKKYGEIKFPGGGREAHERAFDVLRREVAEETGYAIHRRIIPFGSTLEYAKDFEQKFDIFLQLSHYYFCRVHETIQPLALEGYEIEYGYEPLWMTAEEALKINQSIPANDRIPWKERDTQIMMLLVKGR